MSYRYDEILYPIIICSTYFIWGAHFSIFPTLTVNIFGMVNGPTLWSIFLLAMPLSSLLGPFFAAHFTTVNVLNIAACFSMINVFILFKFDDSEMKIYDIIEEREESESIDF